MKMDPADTAFSKWIRMRDGECVRCHSLVRYNADRLPVSHHASHYCGRRREGTRFEPDNVDTLCHACHRWWETEDREAYREYKVAQLGQERFDEMTLQSRLYHKKDRKSEELYWKLELKKLVGTQG